MRQFQPFSLIRWSWSAMASSGNFKGFSTSDRLLRPVFSLLCSRWFYWRAVRATATAPLALTPSSPSARCSSSPSRAPAPAAVRTRPNWRRWGCAAPAGDVSQRPTDTSSPATVKSAAEQRPATSGALSTTLPAILGVCIIGFTLKVTFDLSLEWKSDTTLYRGSLH